MVLTRWSCAAFAVGLSLVAGATALGGDRMLTARREAALAESYLIAIAADLRADRDSLEQALARVEARIRLADHLLDWSSGESAGSSATRMEALADIGRADPPALTSDAFSDLAFTNRAHIVRNPRVREGMVAYYRMAAGAEDQGRDEVASYVAWMEAHLARGPWLHWRGEGEPGRYPLNFASITAELREAGLEAAVRGARRGLEGRRDYLSRLLRANAALIEQIDAIPKG